MARISHIEPGVLEAHWQRYALRAAQTVPAMQFPYAHCFRRAAVQYDLPETLLLAVARGESDFEPNARSHANAYGLMQILWPGTARHLGIHRLSDLLKPCTNVDAGARYLKEMLDRYDGNMHRALAAYNYGPSRIPVSGASLPGGAVWYSSYIFRHLDYVLKGSHREQRDGKRGRYAERGRLHIIRFDRSYRAAALVENLQPGMGDLRLDWFRRPDKGFDVIMLYDIDEERRRGEKILTARGFR